MAPPEPFLIRPCAYATDKDSIVALLRAYRVATGVAVYPTTWRVRLFLTSRVWDPEQDICLWEDRSGRMMAFAMLWRRRVTSPYLVLDRVLHPAFAASELACAMLVWGSQRARAIVAGQAIPLTVYAQDFAPRLHLDSGYASLGFTPVPANPADDNAYYRRFLAAGLPAPALPPGYAVRPVQDMQELKACQAIHSFTAVNPDHQQELFNSDEYSYQAVVDAQGRLAAYCESSFDRGEWQESGQRIGWIDYIETRPDQQGLGLGQAVMWAGLGWLQSQGAQTAMLVTVSSNLPANRLYARTGFARVENLEPPRYELRIGEEG